VPIGARAVKDSSCAACDGKAGWGGDGSDR
jgi:hypothetical protein